MPPPQAEREPQADFGNPLPVPAAAEAPTQDSGYEFSSDKLSQIRDLVTEGFGGETPDVVFAHSGGMYFSEARDRHRATSYSQLTEHGQATGGRLRVIAAAEIAEALPEVGIVTNSFNRFDPEEPTMASVVKSELVHRGVDPERIEMEESSFSTITQMVEMVRMSVKNKWERVLALTNEFHLPRMTAMFDMLETIIDDADFQQTLAEFRARGTQVQFMPAERVLLTADVRFAKYIDRVADSEQYAKTVAAEAQGLQDLLNGKYRIVLQPEKPRD